MGRIALDNEDELAGDGFYVGGWHQEWDGVLVVSWATPIASLFYKGRSATYHLASDVQACRTFIVDQMDLQDFVDELEVDVPPTLNPFTSRVLRPLAVPRPPNQAASPAATAAAEGEGGHCCCCTISTESSRRRHSPLARTTTITCRKGSPGDTG